MDVVVVVVVVNGPISLHLGLFFQDTGSRFFSKDGYLMVPDRQRGSSLPAPGDGGAAAGGGGGGGRGAGKVKTTTVEKVPYKAYRP